jgi:PIN domain-containing protein
MKFFFDENLSIRLAEGMGKFGEDTCHLLQYFEMGTPDEIWLQHIGKQGWILVTVDKRIRKRPLEIEALKKFHVGAFFLAGKTMGGWDRVKQVVRAWHRMKEIAEKEKRPFIFQVNNHGTDIEKLSL